MSKIFLRILSVLIQASAFWALQSCAETSSALRSRWETQDGVPVVIDSVYYTVSGSTLVELQSEIERLGPKDGAIQRYATTEYDIRWTYRFRPKGQRCTFAQVDVGARFIVTFPRWNPPGSASAETIEKWSRFVASVRIHEAGHRDLALRAAGRILRKLQSLPGAPSCGELDASASYEGRTILKEFQKLQAEYDDTTSHGATQGVKIL